MTAEIASHIRILEPKLLFHPDNPSSVDIHPLRGLLNFGPYSAGLIPNPIRIATIASPNDGDKLYRLLKELNSTCQPTERRDYLRQWPGFHSVFKINMCAASKHCHICLEDALDDEIERSNTPHITIVENVIRAIQRLCNFRSEFDVLFLFIPERWSPGFTGSDEEDFDLHDHLKATTAALGIPIQIVREDRAFSYSDRASVMWRIGLALYAKAGGVPWKLAETENDVAYIGISYALKMAKEGEPKFVTCCSQVFDAEGAGLEFIAYDANEVDIQKDNPFLSRTEMFRVMTRSLDLYRRRHSGCTPRRIMLHKSTEFKLEEITGCMEALHLCDEVDLVQIVEDVGWRGIKANINPNPDSPVRALPTDFPVDRGSLLGLSQRDCLLWVHGNVEGVTNNNNYFQGARSTPRPIRLVRHAGHGPWDATAHAVLSLSKMNWNNDSLYDQLPVTMSYAKVLARVVKRMPKLGTMPYQFRFFM